MNIKSIIIYEGKVCNLCLFQEELYLEACLKFINNPVINKYLTIGFMTMSRPKEKEWIKNTLMSDTIEIFAIETKDGKYIGNIGFHNINLLHRLAEIGIVIGDKDEWGKGVASEAESILIKHGFNNLNLNKIHALVIKDNLGSQGAGKNNGFVIEGTLRQHIYSSGKYHDVLIGSILREDWLKKQ